MRFLFVFLCFFVSTVAEAATLYIDPPTVSLNRGDAITVAVRIDTDESTEECINAVDGVINFTENITPVDVSLGESILPVWIESPVIDKENRRITFAGGIPNGYCGRVEGDPRLTNTLFQIVFRAPGLQIGGGENSGRAEVTFGPETTAYQNDGFGTKAETKAFGTVFTISPTIGSEILDPWREDVLADDIAPEAFSITLERDEFAFNGDYYIVFNTTDKQTGLSHYEVIEESVEEAGLFSFGAATAPWEKVRSPYVLKDQTLRSVVRVRAIDKAGNEYLATLAPQGSSLKPWETYLVPIAIAIVTIIGALGIFWFVRRRIIRNRNAQQIEIVDYKSNE